MLTMYRDNRWGVGLRGHKYVRPVASFSTATGDIEQNRLTIISWTPGVLEYSSSSLRANVSTNS